MASIKNEDVLVKSVREKYYRISELFNELSKRL